MPESSAAHIVPCASYEREEVRAALCRALEAVGGLDWVRPGMRVAIKLNLCAARRPEQAATTHPVMAAELTRLLRERGARVILGDSPGEPFVPGVLNRVYSVTGLSLCREAGGELNRDCGHSMVDLPGGVTLKRFAYCRWLENCDAVINFCKLKSHGLMGMTAALKNLFGAVPGTVKGEYHFRYPDPMAFANIMVDLNEYIRPRLCLCDAVEIMEGNGPTQGTPRHMGALLVSRDPYELDRLCAGLLGIREEELLILTAAKERGLLSREPAVLPPEAAAFALEGFVRSGATSSWFAADPKDGPVRRLLKKALAALLRSRPGLGEGCTGCGHCASLCPAGAIKIENGRAVIDRRACVRCFCCQEFCPAGAMEARRSLTARLLSR